MSVHHGPWDLLREEGTKYPIDKPIVRRLIERDGPNCFYCDHPLALYPHQFFSQWKPAEGFRRFAKEHVLPYARGGSSRIENLVLACHVCNTRKGRRTPGEWLGGGANGCILRRVRTRHPELRAAAGLA